MQLDKDSFSASLAENMPAGHENKNLRESAVNNSLRLCGSHFIALCAMPLDKS